jgi:hypothetical protein
MEAEMTGSAFERVSSNGQPGDDEQKTTLSKLLSLFASLRAKLIIPYVVLTLRWSVCL